MICVFIEGKLLIVVLLVYFVKYVVVFMDFVRKKNFEDKEVCG